MVPFILLGDWETAELYENSCDFVYLFLLCGPFYLANHILCNILIQLPIFGLLIVDTVFPQDYFSPFS